MKLPLLVVLAIAAAGCVPARPPPVAIAHTGITMQVALVNESYVLPNGLLVVLHQANASSVHVRVRYDVGSKDDPHGRAGLAHLHEHLMFAGLKHGNGRSFAQWVDGVGGAFNAITTPDATDYFETVAPSQLALALWLESDRMAYPYPLVDDAELAKEREVVKNEWRSRIDNVDYGEVDFVAREAVFGEGHPYAHPTGGRGTDIDAITLADARAFERTYYRPNNATLVIAGAFDSQEARDLVTRYFATIPPGPPRPALVAHEAARSIPARIDLAANVPVPMVELAWAAPRIHADGYEELALGVTALCEDVIYSLVLSHRLARDVGCGMTPGRLASMVHIRVPLRPDASVEEVMRSLDGSIGRAAKLGRTAPWAGFSDLQTREIVSATSSIETLSSRAFFLLHGLEYHGVADVVESDMKRALAVEPQDVGSAIEQFLQKAPRVVVVVTPTPGAPRAGKRVGT